jgi:uncharacterized protein
MNKETQLSSERFEQHKQTLLAIINHHIPHCKVYLFGSRAQGRQRSGSDIDLALDADRVIDEIIMARIKNDIEDSAVPFFVDVIDLHDVSDDFKTIASKDFIVWKN